MKLDRMKKNEIRRRTARISGRWCVAALLVPTVLILTAVGGGKTVSHPAARENPILFPIYERGKIGYIDVTGKTVIEPRLDANGDFSKGNFAPAQYFHEGVAVAARCFEGEKKCRDGFVDATGKFVIDPVYEDALQFSGGLAPVKTAGRWGYVDRAGVMVIGLQLVEADVFENGFARVTYKGGRRTLVNRAGVFLKMPRGTQDFGRPSENLIAVKIGGKWGFMNTRGRIVVKPQFEPELNDYGDDEYDGRFLNGMAAVKLGGKWGYINRRGDLVIPPRFRWAEPFQENDLAIVTVNAKRFGNRIINRQGVFAGSVFDGLYEFSEGLAAVYSGGKWGFVNGRGDIVIPAVFEQVRSFSEGLAAVKFDDRWGYLDRTGKFVIEPQFYSDSWFENGLAYQSFDRYPLSLAATGQWGYIDRTGKFVWKTK